MTDPATTDSTIDPVTLLSERFERAIHAAFPDLGGPAQIRERGVDPVPYIHLTLPTTHSV